MSAPSSTHRRADVADAGILVRFEDMASGGLAAEFWAAMAEPGQSPQEAGAALFSRQSGVHTYKDALLCEVKGAVAGMILGYRLDPVQSLSREFEVPEALIPIFELEAIAHGCWHIDSLAVLPDYRRQGIATGLLGAARTSALAENCQRMSVIVDDRNRGAANLYEHQAFAPLAERAILPNANWPNGGRWLLMIADLSTANEQE